MAYPLSVWSFDIGYRDGALSYARCSGNDIVEFGSIRVLSRTKRSLNTDVLQELCRSLLALIRSCATHPHVVLVEQQNPKNVKAIRIAERVATTFFVAYEQENHPCVILSFSAQNKIVRGATYAQRKNAAVQFADRRLRTSSLRTQWEELSRTDRPDVADAIAQAYGFYHMLRTSQRFRTLAAKLARQNIAVPDELTE